MPSHFSSIGMPVNNQEEFLAIANRVGPLCTSVESPTGTYLRWSSPCGAELWLQVSPDNALVGMNPHFGGESVVRVGLTTRITRPDSTDLDGAFHGWASPKSDDAESGMYPFVFDSPDFRCHETLPLPTTVNMQIAAFAHEVTLYPSQAAYDSASASPGGLKFASRSFIPSGLFAPSGETTDPPQALAIFTGHILKAELRQNEFTGERFWWALVDSLEGIFDVVMDPELVDSAPRVGGILTGSFWLSGRLLT